MWLVVPYRQQKAAFHERMAAFHAGRRPLNMTRADLVRLRNVVLPRREMAVLHHQMKESGKTRPPTPGSPSKPIRPGCLDDPSNRGTLMRRHDDPLDLCGDCCEGFGDQLKGPRKRSH